MNQKERHFYFCECGMHAIEYDYHQEKFSDETIYDECNIYLWDLVPQHEGRNFWEKIKICFNYLFKKEYQCIWDIVLSPSNARKLAKEILEITPEK